MSENLLELVPKQTVQWVEEDGRIVLLKPKTRFEFIRKRMTKRDYRIKLDDYGSLVWKNIDGTKSVEEIGKILRDSFGDAVEPVYDRLGEFLSIMEENGLIKLKD